MSKYIWNGFDDELVLLTAMPPSDRARMHLSDDFIQLCHTDSHHDRQSMVENDADELHLGFTACVMENNIAST